MVLDSPLIPGLQPQLCYALQGLKLRAKPVGRFGVEALLIKIDPY